MNDLFRVPLEATAQFVDLEISPLYTDLREQFLAVLAFQGSTAEELLASREIDEQRQTTTHERSVNNAQAVTDFVDALPHIDLRDSNSSRPCFAATEMDEAVAIQASVVF